MSIMGLTWLLLLACALACASADRGGSSLRGALEALQRRQRGRMHGPILPQPDYESLYEFVPPQGYPGTQRRSSFINIPEAKDNKSMTVCQR